MLNYFEEMKKIHREIQIWNQEASALECYAKEHELIDLTKKILGLQTTARHEGLLALEEAAEGLESIMHQEYLQEMILLVVDGTDPDLLEKIGMFQYCSSLAENYEALGMFLCLEGALQIQDGVNPRVLEKILLSMLPGQVARKYLMQKEKEENTDNASLVDQLCAENRTFPLPPESDNDIGQLEGTLNSMNCRSIQRVLQDVDRQELALAMHGLSGEVRRRLFDNMSDRLALEIAENMNLQKLASEKDIIEEMKSLWQLILRLEYAGEIICKLPPVTGNTDSRADDDWLKSLFEDC